MAALRTVWSALVSLYEEMLVLVAGNLAALALNLPIGLVLLAIALLVVPGGEGSSAQWLVAMIAWLLPFLPTPGNLALANLARVSSGSEIPHFADFIDGLRSRWRLGVRSTLVSVLVLAALVWNIVFYVQVGSGWVRFVSILWLYATLSWLSLHVYVIPFAAHVAEPRLFDVYRRAAFVALGHPGYTVALLLALLVVGFAALVFVPVYVLVGGAFISLAQAQALREIRRRHGDLVAGADEEVSSL
ncbi:MAG TPA: hypothetical protein VF937_05015 [Chloroflexota bacterium]